MGPLFLPPVVGNVDGPLAALTIGTLGGGTNWPGAAYDPETHIVYAQAANCWRVAIWACSRRRPASPTSATSPGAAGQPFRLNGRSRLRQRAPTRRKVSARQARLTPSSARRRSRAVRRSARRRRWNGLTVQGLPLVKPPYGVLSAINLDRGELMWQVPHGDTPDAVRNHPALKGLNIPKTGQPGSVGLMVTKTLVDPRRSAGDDDAGASARRDAARLRQADRQGSRRGLDAGAAERLADDLHRSTASSTSSSRSAAATTRASTSPSACLRPNRRVVLHVLGECDIALAPFHVDTEKHEQSGQEKYDERQDRDPIAPGKLQR